MDEFIIFSIYFPTPLSFSPHASLPLSSRQHHVCAHTHTHIHTHRLHEFTWHGPDPKNPGRYIPYLQKFKQLCHIPTQIYVNVKDVRTNDDSLITVKLMVFYRLVDVNIMVSVVVVVVVVFFGLFLCVCMCF